jgi:hypothetical protein
VDVTESAGLKSTSWAKPETFQERQCQTTMAMGPGAAAADYDGDGFIDLFVARYDLANQLFRNQGDGTFEDVAATAGVAVEGVHNGAAWGDVDGDGDVDLYVTAHFGPTLLHINQGDGTFTEEAAARGAQLMDVAGVCAGMFSASFSDFDHDGDLDLHTAESEENGTELTRLLVNNGAGTFIDATESSGIFSNQSAFTPVVIDVNGDHWEDLLAVGDFGSSRLYLNQQDGTFEDVTEAWHVGTDDSGMGSSAADVNGDGLIDWFITAIAGPHDIGCTQLWGCSGNRLFINTGGDFEDRTDEYGVRLGGWGWGAAFVDYDLDSDLDIAMVGGFTPGDDPANFGELQQALDPFKADPVKLWENTSSRPWNDVAGEAGFIEPRESKAFIPFDYDNDGDLDFFVTNTGSTPSLFRNDAPCNRDWLRVLARGQNSNRSGIGVEVYLTVSQGDKEVRRDISASSNFLGTAPAEAHFGLGAAGGKVHRLRVYWPATNRTELLRDVPTNQVLIVEEPNE